MKRFRIVKTVDRVFGASTRRNSRAGRRFCACSVPGAEILEDRLLLASIIASGVISSTPDGSNFDYTIQLTNSSTSTASIGTFWYAWVPGGDFLATSPVAVTPPNGWSDNITHAGAGDGYAIQFISKGSSDNVLPGNSLNFAFTSADTPASVNGDSMFYPGTPVGTSFVYSGGPEQGVSDEFVVTAASTLQSIAVTPANTTLPTGETEQFTATGTLSNNTTENLTSQVTWASSDTTWATINSAGLATAVSPGPVTISAAFDGKSGSTGLTITSAALRSIAVAPVNPSVAKGLSEQFTATGTYTDNSTQNLTNQVTWASGTTSVATISNTAGSQGLASTLAAGTTAITASLSGVTSPSDTLTVTAPALMSIAVAPVNPSVAKGLTEQFTATGTYTDGSTTNLTTQVTWASGTTSVATISNAAGSQGLATTLAVGTTAITATLSGITSPSDTLTVTAAALVSIAVAPVNPSVAKGLTEQFTATGTYTDRSTQNLSSQVTWVSGTTSVAMISNTAGSQGLASTLATGTTAITAALNGITSPSDTLTVTAAALVSIAVAPVNPSVAKGLTEQFTATGTFTDGSTQNLSSQVTWVSGTTSIAMISNTAGSQGLASTLAVGTTAITASLSGVTSPSDTLTVTAAALVSIAVAPVNPSVAKGLTEQFTASGTYTDGSTQNLSSQVTWVSTTTSVATISNTAGSQGLASTLATGTTAITASMSGVTSPSDTLTVTAATLVSIAVAPVNPSVAKGLTEQFTATGTYTDGSTQNLSSQVTWVSTTTSVATISNTAGSQGLTSTLATGTTAVTAALSGITSPSDTLTVTAAALVSIAVAPVNPSVAKGQTEQFTATGTYTDGSTQNLSSQVTWVSGTTSVATISNTAGSQGLASTLATGTTAITAALSGITSPTDTLTVTAAALTTIAVAPVNPSVAKGLTEQFTATGTFTDGSTANLTTQVTWTSGTTSVATISNAAGTQGLASTLATGTTAITASMSGITSPADTLTVTPGALVSIALSPTGPTVAKGLTQQFTATGTYTDGSSAEVTTQVAWVSGTTSVVAISNTAGSQELATTLATGTSSISATLDGVTGSTVLTVSAAVLQSIALTPASPSIAKGETEQFTATGTYSDKSTQDLTSQVTWLSATSSVATITSAGLATGVATGTSTVSAALNGITGSTVLTVSPAALLSIAVTPDKPFVPNGNTEQFTATGTFSDQSTEDLTSQVTWTSSDTTWATINSAGLATAVSAGPVTISAVFDGITGSTGLTVTAPILTSIAVTPANTNLITGTTEQFTATGTLSNNTTENLTSQVTWASSDTTWATISTTGMATAVSAGPVTISATFDGVTGSTGLTVANPPPTLTHTAVTGEQPVLTRKLNNRGKPTGKPILSGFMVDFGVPLSNASVSNRGIFQLDTVTTKRVKGKIETILHPIKKFTVGYVAASNAIEVKLGSAQAFPTGGQLTVLGGMTTASDSTLSGPAVFKISQGGKSIISV